MAFRVEMSAEAERDAFAILDWLVLRDAGEAGLRWFEGLQEAVLSLEAHPDRYPLAAEDGDVPLEVRELVYGRRPGEYRVLFTVEGERVLVIHIRNGRRQPVLIY
jgi:plasmid stabilization system protein ParE